MEIFMKNFLYCRFLAALGAITATLFFLALQKSSLADGPKDKKPQYTNRLAKETSPYLLMHAHNPTDWYPWGPEAFAKAKKEGKLVFLSIGYSSCYWCHVMERESFDNPEIAKMLNKWFVCIKVDREERPDIDNIYMTALDVMPEGISGGWPLSMFLTADAKPIIGGTYWPPEDKVVGNVKMLGFKSVLEAVHNISKNEPEKLEKRAEAIAEATQRELQGTQLGLALVDLDRKLVEEAITELKMGFDSQYGGFGSPSRKFKGPKFPTPCRLELLLQEGQRTKSDKLIDMVTLTLDKMARGGIYDQIGGGFHRYSTERTWTVPHFEKMLYDNAQLTEVYAKAYQITKKPLYERILRETLDYVMREMMSPEGAIYSSQDAETDEEEGRFYVWTNKELAEAIPDEEDLKFLMTVYGVDKAPNFEGKYHILHLPRPLEESAKKLGLSQEKFMSRLERLKKTLYKVRSQREKPFRNEISLTAWSGLMIAGFAEAGRVLDEQKYINTAKKAADFVLRHQKTDKGRLLRTYGAAPGKPAKAAVNGYLEDYAFLVHGLLTLHEVTGEKKWLQEAQELTDTMIRFHGGEKRGGYYFTAHDHEKLFARSKDQYDGATPAGNSLALRNLVRLWIKTGDKKYRDEAQKGFEFFAGSLKNYPSGLTTMVQALNLYLDAIEAEKSQKKEAKEPSNKE